MNGMTDSHAVGLINAQAKGITLAAALDLLKRANRYVGTASSVKAMELSVEITEFVAKARQGEQ